jgi:hypothetical protein
LRAAHSESRTTNNEQRSLFRLPRGVRQLIIFAFAAAALWAANVIQSPTAMMAQTAGAGRAFGRGPSESVRLKRQEFVNHLATLIGQSVEVLAVHTRDNTPYTEIVLWLRDDANPGVIDPDELVVVSHSRLFETVTKYALPTSITDELATIPAGPAESSIVNRQSSIAGPRPGAAAGPGAIGGQGLRLPQASVAANMMLDRALASQPGFCDRWRGSPQVLPHVLATGLSDLIVEPCGSSRPGDADELSVVRLSLRWAGDSSDGAQDMSVLVEGIRD